MKSFLLLTFFLTLTGLAIGQWQPLNGPCGGTVSYFLHKDQFIFAGTPHGVYRTSNGGSSWTAVNNGLANPGITGIAASNTAIFAATDGGLFITTDNGNQWHTSIINGFAGLLFQSVAAGGNTVLVTTSDGKVLRSPDNGVTWDTILATSCTYMHAEMNGSEVFIGISTQSIYYSSDSGAHFTLIDNCPFEYAHSFAFKGSKIFASAFPIGSWSSYVFVSSDHGSNWNFTGNTVLMDVNQVAVNGNLVYATSLKSDFGGGPGGVFLSADDGAHWAAIGLSGTTINSLGFSGSKLIAGTDQAGVYISDDAGSHWTESSNGLTPLAIQLVVKNGSTLFAVNNSDGEGILVSNDDGLNWRHANNGLPKAVGALIVQSSTLIAGDDNQIFYSEDNGASWVSKINTGYQVNCLQSKGNALFAGTEGGGIFLSSDHGLTWSSVNNGLKNMNIKALTIKGPAIYTGTENGLYKSTDNGTTWVSADSGIPVKNITSLTANSTYLFTAMTSYQALSSYSAFYRSDDDGANWVNTGPEFHNIWYSTSFAVDQEHIIAGINDEPQILFSDDNGINWSVLNSGLPGNYGVKSLYISGQTLYATTTIGSGYEYEGIWKRPLQELIAFKVQPDTLFLSSEQGNYASMNITSTTPWTVEGTLPGWLATDKQGGPGTGTLIFTTSQINPYPVPRFADLDISSMGMMRHVVICQHEKVFGVNEKEANNLAIFPNPTTGFLKLETQSPFEKATVYNSMGLVVLEVQVKSAATRIDLTTYHKGVYFIAVTGKSGTSIRRVVLL